MRGNPNPTITKEFREQQGLKLNDLPQDEKMYPSMFGVRLPQDVAEKLLLESGRKNTALLRRILVRITRDYPELYEQFKAELDA
ncbi:hypothetical protein FEK30_00105 (plasmid) [Picosynechococcus sp. PCC 11901]|uniref:hypothetical protein n=1 Tax=Picosynechococcus sp. PCC 11901 TaxID=2579791 RepID=UPI0010FC34DC|nr:hypothetical protein [Picosynechococcus sp. PCC 11901]QCS47974.1 hypothetical protein FEK30_00105 [Picosynechococcus sp. PCC 11901]